MGYVVLNIFRNYIPIMCATYYMVMIATLPPEFNVIAPGIHCDGPLKSTYHNRQCRPECRDARLVRPIVVSRNRPIVIDGYDGMYMIGHHGI